VRSGSPLGYEGDPEEGKELGPRARQSRRAKIRVRNQAFVPERRHCQGDPSHLSGSLKACRFLSAPDILKGPPLMQPGMLRCNGAPGEGIPLQQARTRGQEMVMLYRLF